MTEGFLNDEGTIRKLKVLSPQAGCPWYFHFLYLDGQSGPVDERWILNKLNQYVIVSIATVTGKSIFF